MSAQPCTPLALSEFAFEVHAGLTKEGQKTLPCRYFYDDVGTALFQTISLLPEYGLTRADDRVIRASAGELADLLRTPVAVVELGSGTGSKTRRILEALSARASVTYYPIDVSLTALQCCRRELSDVAEVVPVEASYLEGVTRAVSLRKPRERILTLFLGSTIGNFERSEMAQFLQEVRARLAPRRRAPVGNGSGEVRIQDDAGLRRSAGGDSGVQPEPPGADQSRIGWRLRHPGLRARGALQPIRTAHRDAPAVASRPGGVHQGRRNRGSIPALERPSGRSLRISSSFPRSGPWRHTAASTA